jgi:hypothetical protein
MRGSNFGGFGIGRFHRVSVGLDRHSITKVGFLATVALCRVLVVTAKVFVPGKFKQVGPATMTAHSYVSKKNSCSGIVSPVFWERH